MKPSVMCRSARGEPFVDVDRRSRLGGAEVAVRREIPGVVVHHPVCRGDFLSADLANLGIGCGAMQAGGNQDRDLFPRDARLLPAGAAPEEASGGSAPAA